MLIYQNIDLNEAIWIIKLLNYYHSFFLKKKIVLILGPSSQSGMAEEIHTPA